jgi:AraC-like DNA-binding protein
MPLERHLILQEVILRPSGEWKPEGRAWTMVRVVEGIGYGLQSGGARELKSGDGFTVCGGSPLLLRASQLGTLKLEYFSVQPQLLNGLITITEGHQLEQALKRPEAQILPFNAVDVVGQKFSRMAAQPQRDCLSHRSGLLQLWSQAVAGVLHLPSVSDHSQKLRERFLQLIAQIPDAELPARTLAELAEQLHCSERHFSRLFREEFGVSLRSRQTEIRLLRARQMLVESESKIIHIAYESGYRHIGQFNSMFKKRFGVTPSEWRHQNFIPKPKNGFKNIGVGLALILLLAELFLGSGARAQTADNRDQAQARGTLEQRLAELDKLLPPEKTNNPPPESNPLLQLTVASTPLPR